MSVGKPLRLITCRSVGDPNLAHGTPWGTVYVVVVSVKSLETVGNSGFTKGQSGCQREPRRSQSEDEWGANEDTLRHELFRVVGLT